MHHPTTADLIVESLIQHEVDTLFGLPGVQTYELFDSLQRAGERIRVVGARHEQAAGYMAFGYAKSTGCVGAFTVVPGPGVLNAGAALCTAYGTSAPVLCLTGQVPADYVGSGKGHLHELPDQLALLRGLTKWSERIRHPGEVSQLMSEAFRQMHSGRPRPVALEVPWDVFGQRAPAAMRPAAQRTELALPDPELIQRAADLIAQARNPMIMVGSGAQEASDEVMELAEAIQAPVVSFRGGRGVVSDDHPLGFTCAAGYRRWADADVLVGIGCRMELLWFRWPKPDPALKVVLIDIDPDQITRLRPTLGIVADAALATRDLANALREEEGVRPSRSEEFIALKARVQRDIQVVQPQMGHLQAIRQALPRDGFFVEEISQVGFTSHFGFPVYEPRTFVTSGHQGTLGFGFPTALGVKVGNPDKAVVSITGDGGFMFGVQELATAVQYGINLVTVVFNNNAYGNVLRDQQTQYSGRDIGAKLRNPDFVTLATSFGVAGYRVHTSDELRSTLERAFDADAPALIEVPVKQGSEVSPWPFLMPQG